MMTKLFTDLEGRRWEFLSWIPIKSKKYLQSETTKISLSKTTDQEKIVDYYTNFIENEDWLKWWCKMSSIGVHDKGILAWRFKKLLLFMLKTIGYWATANFALGK
jgi:hypothetical protein